MVKPVRMVSPENGWAYMICVGFVLTFGVCFSPSNSFGLIFNEFLRSEEGGENLLSYITGMCGLMIAMSGPLVNVCLRRVSLRKLAVFGACLYALSWFVHAFVPSPRYMIFTFGVLNGLAWGILQITSYIVFNAYFVRKRVAMMGLGMTVVGLGPIVAPFFIEASMRRYGFRATVALIAAVCANAIAGTALYRPVEWHLVPERDEDDDEDPAEKEKQMQNMDSIEQCEPLMKKSEVEKDDEDRSWWSKYLETSNLRLFKRLTYWNICTGIGFGLIGDIYFGVLMPSLLFEYELPSSQVATCVSIVALADLGSRLLLGILGKCLKIRSYHWYYAGMIVTTLTRLLFMQFTTFYELGACLFVYGFMRAWVYILFPILIAEEMPDEDYGSAFALCSAFNFLFNALYTTVTGVAKSVTGTYVVSFYLITLSALIPLVPWTIELFIVRPMRKNKEKSHSVR